MRRYSPYLRERIVRRHQLHFRPSAIINILGKEGFNDSKVGIYYQILLKKWKQTKSIYDAPRSGRPSVLTEGKLDMIEAFLTDDDELTTTNVLNKLRENNAIASRSSVARARICLGWTAKATRYCQMIRTNNKIKLDTAETFDDIVFTDETNGYIKS